MISFICFLTSILALIQLFLVNNCKGFEVLLTPRKLDNDTNLNQLTPLLHDIPYLLPTINLCFGNPNQCFNLALSTYNAFSVLESSDSIRLVFNNQFKYKESTTFKIQEDNADMGVFVLGLHYYLLEGKISEDRLTIPTCLKQSTIPFKFVINVNKNKDLPHINFDGFIGMQKFYDDRIFFCQTGFSLMESLIRAEFIKKKAFILEYDTKGGGRVLFGEEEYSSQHKTCNCSKNYYNFYKWDCLINEIRMGNEKLELKVLVNYDSIKSFIQAPGVYGGDFVIEYILKHYSSQCWKQEEKNNTIIICNEETNIKEMPDLILKMDETELIIQWINVFRLNDINGVKKYYGSFIVGNVIDELYNRKYWTIGVPGFIDNSIVFDHDENRIGIKFLGSKVIIKTGTLPYISFIIIMSGFVSVIGIGLLIAVNSFIIRRKETLI